MRRILTSLAAIALVAGGCGGGGKDDGGRATPAATEPASESAAPARDVVELERRTEAEPDDADAWADLAIARFRLAGVSEGFDANTGRFAGRAREEMDGAVAAWDRHLRLAGERPDREGALFMANAFVALGRFDRAVQAREIVIDTARRPTWGDFAQLAVVAWQARQVRKGDLAADRAVELAPARRRRKLRDHLTVAKAGALREADAAGEPAPPSGP
jgi:hypothetical protein